ncbi:MAG: hypothetical protein AB1817_20260, partial [Chloroflexota bacterium]
DLSGVRPGEIYFMNLAASALLLIVLVLTIAPGAFFQEARRSIPYFEQAVYGIQVSLLIVFAFVVLYFGVGFISNGLMSASK